MYQCTHKQSNKRNRKPIRSCNTSNSVNINTLQLDMNCILLMGERYKKWFGQIKLRSISPTCQGWLGPTAKWINTTMIINIGNLSNKHPLPNGYHYHKEHYCEPHYLHQQYHLDLLLAVVLYSWNIHISTSTFIKIWINLNQDVNKSEVFFSEGLIDDSTLGLSWVSGWAELIWGFVPPPLFS